ncbi:MAG: hypothetical protein J5584_04925 [Clostridia bacterium]|nr:hypothetical protein [Clostridia bacterium]
MSIKVGLIVADRRSVRLCIERGTDHGIDADRIRYFDVEVCYPSMDAAVLRRFDGVFSIVDEAGRECVYLPRFVDGYDTAVCRFRLFARGAQAEGPAFAEELKDPLRNFPYPAADTKKGLQIADIKDAIELGVRHAALNVSQGDLLELAPDGDNTLEFPLDGRTYYFNRKNVEACDAKFKELTDAGIIITLILLNSPKWTRKVPDALWKLICHPDYAEGSDALISEFNITTPEAVGYYRAFVAFLADRYARADGQYGRAVGMIVGNEVNSGWIWCNAGVKGPERYSEEYADIVRLTWQTAAAYYSGIRVYLSFDHFWTGDAAGGKAPDHYFGAKAVLDTLNKRLTKEGNVPWNIAHHPYPEDLNYPDFWNDKTAPDSPDAPIITFKNLQVLAEFTYEPAFLYRGRRRRIILSEQGFNSHWTPESEVLQAMAYGLAYKKVMSIPEIDSFILHAHHDNLHEFGLNLGLWRRSEDGSRMVAPKPIYYVFKAIDKKDERGVYHWERY